MLNVIIISLTVGMFAGFLAGLFGIGGGLILVPVIMICLKLIKVNPEILMHLTIGTSLTCIFITSSNSAYSHYKKGPIDWKTFKKLIFGIFLGVIFGGKIASFLSSKTLEIIFALFLATVTLKMWMSVNIDSKKRYLPTSVYWLVGCLIGFKSAVLGIGGGTISIPFLTWSGSKMKDAVGVSAFIGVPISLIGSLSYLYNGLNNPLLPEYSLGFIYLPTFLGIISTSAVFARIGARMSHTLPQDRLYKLFALFLTIVLTKTIFGLF